MAHPMARAAQAALGAPLTSRDRAPVTPGAPLTSRDRAPVTPGAPLTSRDRAPVRGEGELTDEELTELALAADPFAPLPADAVPLDLQGEGWELLPTWYMAPVRRRRVRHRYRLAAAAVVAALLTIDLFGLCSTYGPLVLA